MDDLLEYKNELYSISNIDADKNQLAIVSHTSEGYSDLTQFYELFSKAVLLQSAFMNVLFSCFQNVVHVILDQSASFLAAFSSAAAPIIGPLSPTTSSIPLIICSINLTSEIDSLLPKA